MIVMLALAYYSQKSPQEPPEIAITIGDKKIEYFVAKNEWDNAKYDREDTFKSILKEVKEEEIPYINIGETVTINFRSNSPKEFIVYDILIAKNGNQIFTNLKENVAYKKNKGNYSFEIKKNMASVLSSYYEENKKDIRGFRMIAKWGQDECEYAFVIKTDAY
jgi:hypothetical protein